MKNTNTHTHPWFTWTSCAMWGCSPGKQGWSPAKWHTGHKNMPLMANSRIQDNTSSNSNQPLPLHTVTGTASARDISCGGLLFGSDMKQVYGSDQFLWWWRVGTLKGGQQIPLNEGEKKKKKTQAALQGCNHGEVEDSGSNSVNQKGGFYLLRARLVSQERNFLWFLLDGAQKVHPTTSAHVLTLIGQQRAPFDNLNELLFTWGGLTFWLVGCNGP